MATGGGGDRHRFPSTDPRDRTSYRFAREPRLDDSKMNSGARSQQSNSTTGSRLNNWVKEYFSISKV